MKYQNGVWSYWGCTYPTLREALAAVWPAREVDIAELVYSVTEAAEVLGISRQAMYVLIHQEGFPTLKVGSRRLISRELLAQWVREQAGGVQPQ